MVLTFINLSPKIIRMLCISQKPINKDDIEWKEGFLHEIRFDHLETSEWDKFKNCPYPTIFTKWDASEDELEKLASLEPTYLDIPQSFPLSVFERIQNLYPSLKVICSYHNFKETPQDLNSIYKDMQSKPASLYKLATMAHSSLDGMRMLQFVSDHENVAGMCMGELGQITRILGPIYGSVITFAALSKELVTAPGQLTIDELNSIYFWNELSPKTKIYGLIGDPVSHSLTHLTHNGCMRELGIDGVFVKIQVKQDEVSSFLEFTQKLNFSGFAVTMPLKEEVLKHVTRFDRGSEKVGAVNTLKIMPDGISACNTDGVGTLAAIENLMPVKDKRVVVLGAGGAAKAIAHEAKRRGAYVDIVNRSLKRAQILAHELNGKAFLLDQFKEVSKEGYDILVNATSVSMIEKNNCVIDSNLMLSDKICMDVVYHPRETSFLLAAKAKGCRIVDGVDMYLHQAVQQFTFWFGEEIDENKVLNRLEALVSSANFS